MASTLRDSVVHYRKKLERSTDETVALNCIYKLSRVPISLDLLQDTGAGKVIRAFAKKPGKVGAKASAVLYNWRKTLADEQMNALENPTKVKHVKHTSSRKEKSSKETKKIDKNSKKSSSTHVNITDSEDVKVCDFTYEITLKKPVKTHSDALKHDTLLHTVTDDIRQRLPFDKDFNQESNSNHSFTQSKLHSPSKSVTTKNNGIDSISIINDTSRKIKSSEKAAKKDEKTRVVKKEIKPDENQRNPKETAVKVPKEGDIKKHKEKIHTSKTSHKHNSLSDNPASKKHKSEKVESKKSVASNKKGHSGIKVAMKHMNSEAFTSSEVRFEDCLSFNDMVTVKRKKSSKTLSKKKEKHSKQKEKHGKKSKPEYVSDELRPIESLKDTLPHVLETSLKFPLPTFNGVDVLSTLPQTQPNYRPLPQRSYDGYPNKKKALSNEEAIKFTSSRREKTAVYSGRKNLTYTEMPTLFDICTQVLIENIDSIEYMGETPYFIVKPVLERCTAHQLHNIEDYNPYLLEDTQELWEKHCKKDFRTQIPQENETWRDLYWRAHDERDKRLKSVTANISASMSKFKPVRSVKLAYVDSVVKPPRDVARRQAKNGTALPVNHTVKAGPPSKATPRPTAPAINVAAISSKEIFIAKTKPKIAPLMAKTLKSMKQCFRR